MKCKICGVIGKEVCSSCANFRDRIGTRCVACGFDLGYDVNRYIRQGNYCMKCCGKAGRRAFFNAGKLAMFDFKEFINAKTT